MGSRKRQGEDGERNRVLFCQQVLSIAEPRGQVAVVSPLGSSGALGTLHRAAEPFTGCGVQAPLTWAPCGQSPGQHLWMDLQEVPLKQKPGAHPRSATPRWAPGQAPELSFFTVKGEVCPSRMLEDHRFRTWALPSDQTPHSRLSFTT